jgi:hypothetical protein
MFYDEQTLLLALFLVKFRRIFLDLIKEPKSLWVFRGLLLLTLSSFNTQKERDEKHVKSVPFSKNKSMVV